jgi:AraC-like DNA-binding protein
LASDLVLEAPAPRALIAKKLSILHTTFHNFVNSYRVNYAATMLISDPKISILNIAFASDFNSKARFNRIIKKTTCSTPKQYRHTMDSSHPKD